MGLQDFWDNVRTPGFFETMFEELGDICKEAKKEMVGLMEEGEEVFIDGFREMVIKENPEYKNSVQKREEAQLLIKEIRAKLLSARGFTDGSSNYIFGITGLSLKNAATALADLDRNKINEIISDLQTKYEHLSILNPEELLAHADRINELIKLPDAPQYVHPYSESETTFLDTRLREMRVETANIFLSEAKEYVELIEFEVSRQHEVGILIDYSKIEGEVSLLLEKYERRLSIENMSLKFLAEKEEVPDQEDWLKVRSTLLLAAGIHDISRLALVTTENNLSVMTDDLMSALVSGFDEATSREKEGWLTGYMAINKKVDDFILSLEVASNETCEKLVDPPTEHKAS